MSRLKKEDRQQQLLEKLNTTPFITDEELAIYFKVSIPTIRLDRLTLGIPELRERIKAMAEEHKHNPINNNGDHGEVIDLSPGKEGIAVFTTTDDMTDASGYVDPQYLYGHAHALARAIIDTPVAVAGVGNIKYKNPVKANHKLVVKAEIIRRRGKTFFIWVIIKDKNKEVFRSKFTLESVEE